MPNQFAGTVSVEEMVRRVYDSLTPEEQKQLDAYVRACTSGQVVTQEEPDENPH
jgi:hypothetical protein